MQDLTYRDIGFQRTGDYPHTTYLALMRKAWLADTEIETSFDHRDVRLCGDHRTWQPRCSTFDADAEDYRCKRRLFGWAARPPVVCSLEILNMDLRVRCHVSSRSPGLP